MVTVRDMVMDRDRLVLKFGELKRNRPGSLQVAWCCSG